MSSFFGIDRDPRSYGQDPDVTWGGLLGSFGLAFFVQAIAFTAFSFLRRTFYGKQWLTPKRAVCPQQTPPDLHYDTLFGWLPQLMNVSESQILMYCGYDVVMFLKCLRLGFWTLVYFAPYGLGVILPVNWARRRGCAKGYFVTTVSNIEITDVNGDPPPILIVHLVGMCLLQFILMGLTLNLHLEYIQLRRAFMKQRANDATVLVTQIPNRLQSSTLLKKYFEMIYGNGKVNCVQFVKHIEELEKVVASREKTVMKLERSILTDHANNNGLDSKETTTLRDQLNKQNIEVSDLQQEYDDLDTAHEEKMSLSLPTPQALSKVLSSKFDLKSDSELNAWLGESSSDDDDDNDANNKHPMKEIEEEAEEVEEEDSEPIGSSLNILTRGISGDIEMNGGAVLQLTITGSSIEPFIVSLSDRVADVLDLKKAIYAETSIEVETQVLKFKGQTLSDDSHRLASYGVLCDSSIDLEVTFDPSILAHGKEAHSSRRQRLSTSQQYEENIQTSADKLWRRGTALSFRSNAPNTTIQKGKGEKFPLTGSLFDLLKETRLAEKNNKASFEGGSNSNKALVTFNSIAAATIATQAVHSVPDHRELLTVVEAPHSDDVFWANIHKNPTQVRGLRVVTSILTFSLVVFFVLPVTYLNQYIGPAKMESYAIKQNWPWMLKSLGTTLLPMTLVIIANLLPPLFTGLGFFEGCLTWSLNGLRQFDRMMWFLLVNVYGVSIISGTVIESIVDILRNPTGTASIIADVLPTMSGFFIQYLIVKACVAMSIEILRGLTVFHMVTRYLIQCKDATKRERLLVIAGIRRYNNPGWLPFGKHFPHILLVLIICLSFAPVAPLILIPGMIYFANAQIVYRYTLSYIYEPRFEIGGGFWPKVLKWIIRTMYMSQGFMMCVFLLRNFISGVVMCFFMFVVTFQFKNYMYQKERHLLRLPLEVAVRLDLHEGSEPLSKPIHLAHIESESAKERKNHYIQPALVAEKEILPEESLGKTGLWSTDPLHGGICKWRWCGDMLSKLKSCLSTIFGHKEDSFQSMNDQDEGHRRE